MTIGYARQARRNRLGGGASTAILDWQSVSEPTT